MTVITLAQAELEFESAIAYYEAREPGLGEQFRNEVASSIQWIVANPEVLILRRGGYRRFNLHRFPHYVAYVLRGDVLWIVAIAHAHRRPGYWQDRLGRPK